MSSLFILTIHTHTNTNIDSCGNINWARRLTCNMCNAPKIQKTEVRTGAGGGYNERQDVEYKKREESDDEFDEVVLCF